MKIKIKTKRRGRRRRKRKKEIKKGVEEKGIAKGKRRKERERKEEGVNTTLKKGGGEGRKRKANGEVKWFSRKIGEEREEEDERGREIEGDTFINGVNGMKRRRGSPEGDKGIESK